MHVCTPTVTCTVHLIGTGCYKLAHFVDTVATSNVVATSFVSVLSQMPLFGRDMSLEELMSRQLNLVVTSFLDY